MQMLLIAIPRRDLILFHDRVAVGTLELVRGVGLKRVLVTLRAFVTLGHRHSFRLCTTLERAADGFTILGE